MRSRGEALDHAAGLREHRRARSSLLPRSASIIGPARFTASILRSLIREDSMTEIAQKSTDKPPRVAAQEPRSE